MESEGPESSTSNTPVEQDSAVVDDVDAVDEGFTDTVTETQQDSVVMVTERECVVISDDDGEATETESTARYQTSKRARRSEGVVMIREDNVVMVTDEDQPGPSNRVDNVVMVTRPTNPIPVPDDDEPIITNVIDREDRGQSVTWQFVQRSSPTEGVGVRRNAHSVSRYRARRPTARRPIRSRQYGQFMNVMRDLTSEGVIVSPLTRVTNHSNPRRLRSYSRHLDVTFQASQDPINARNISSAGDSIGAPPINIPTLLHRIAPTPNPPLVDKNVLDRAPTKVASEADMSREKKCSICLGHYSIGETLRVLPCEHEFHEYCIDRWLTTCSRKCPFCRTDIQEALT
ncbi:uncharacterized protein LOC134824636 isoform X2 [Bolinopsis microptera]|uniref:uncharacterized protein LOC134824636 isoform X2 n=1 Tax=Bolinopsis microptera TaxID=2820187 RepID=UPI00307A1060